MHLPFISELLKWFMHNFLCRLSLEQCHRNITSRITHRSQVNGTFLYGFPYLEIEFDWVEIRTHGQWPCWKAIPIFLHNSPYLGACRTHDIEANDHWWFFYRPICDVKQEHYRCFMERLVCLIFKVFSLLFVMDKSTYIIQLVVLKLVGVMDKRQVVMYNLWVVMCNKMSLPADFMPFFIDRKLLYPYCNSLLKVFFFYNHF